MLEPVTTANSGRLPDCDQPDSTPAPKAPSAPPPDKASHGPFDGRQDALKIVASNRPTRAHPECPQ